MGFVKFLFFWCLFGVVLLCCYWLVLVVLLVVGLGSGMVGFGDDVFVVVRFVDLFCVVLRVCCMVWVEFGLWWWMLSRWSLVVWVLVMGVVASVLVVGCGVVGVVELVLVGLLADDDF